MQENQLFEYAVIRAVPRVEREEFINVGIVLFCKRLNFLQTRCQLDENKLLCLDEKADVAQLKQYLQAFDRIATGHADGGPIARLDTASRFRWLTATRSTILQTSKVHPGLCSDPVKALEKLHADLVL